MRECIICKKGIDGLHGNRKCCSIECSNINNNNYNTNREHSSNRKKYKKEYQKNYRQIDPDHKRSLNKIYYIQHKKEIDNQAIEYYRSDRGKEIRKAYRKTTKVKQQRRLDKLRRREALHNSVTSYTQKDWRHKIESTKGLCPCCNHVFDDREYKVSLDHTPSLSAAEKKFKRTGIKQVYTIDDVNPLCLRCNVIKNDKDISLDELRELVMKRNKMEDIE